MYARLSFLITVVVSTVATASASAQNPTDKPPPSAEVPDAPPPANIPSPTPHPDPLAEYTEATRAALIRHAKSLYRMPDGAIVDTGNYEQFKQYAQGGKRTLTPDALPPAPLFVTWRGGNRAGNAAPMQTAYIYLDADDPSLRGSKGAIEVLAMRNDTYTLVVHFRSHRTLGEEILNSVPQSPPIAMTPEAFGSIGGTASTTLSGCTVDASARRGKDVIGRRHFYFASNITLYNADLLRMNPADVAAAVEAGDLRLEEWRKEPVGGKTIWTSKEITLKKRPTPPATAPK